MLALVPCLMATQALAGGDVNLFYGQKQLSDSLLEDAEVDGQTEFGIQLSLDFDWPVALAIDVLSSTGDSTIDVPAAYVVQYRTDVSTLEVDVGVRKFWREGLRPYVGGGFNWVKLDAEQVAFRDFGAGQEVTDLIVNDSGNGFGYWLNAGLIYSMKNGFNVGVDLRYSDASATLQTNYGSESLNLDSGGLHYGILLGYRW
jgi:opacity protein-like surface antigen